MISAICLRPLCWFSQVGLAAVAGTTVLVALSGPTEVCAANPQPVLTVAPAQVTVDLAVGVPKTAKPAASGRWQLVEVGRPEAAIAVQWIPAIAADGAAGAEQGRLAASIPPRPGADGPRRFQLQPAEAAPVQTKAAFQWKVIDEKSLGLWDGDQPVLVYNYGTITNQQVPQNDQRRSRGCYVHPLYGLSGEMLSDDFPRDHYHHHGLFWAWPHVGIGARQYDLWTYKDIQQKFVGWIGCQAGPVAAVLGVENGWFVGDKKVMIERVWIGAYKPTEEHRSLDMEFAWIPVDEPITLQGAENKSYGGLNLRFGPRQQTEITVPSGRTKQDLPDTPLAWADLTGKFADAPQSSGAAIFVDPGHPDYPPTWLTRHYGALCVGWPGVKARTFPPGKAIRLNYRVWIHKWAVEGDALGQAYEAYAAAMKAAWK